MYKVLYRKWRPQVFADVVGPVSYTHLDVYKRQQYGSAAPFDILPAVWMVSAIALVAGLLAAKLLEGCSIG